MKKVLAAIINNPKSLVIGLTILTSIFLISLLFPKGDRFEYDYEVGQPWAHESIVAESDFYVWKTKSELEEEKNLIRSQFRPIFQRINNRDVFYQRWKDLLNTAKSNLPVEVSSRLTEYVYQHDSKEVIYGEDLTFDGKLYDRFRLVSGSEDIELRAEDYITVQSLHDVMSPLMKLYPDDPLMDMVTLEQNESLSNQRYSTAQDEITAYKRKINAGETIISRGENVSTRAADALSSLKSSREGSSLNNTIIFFGFLLLTSAIIGVFILYLLLHYPEYFYSAPKIMLLLILIVTMSFLVYSIEHTDNISSYLIPFCIVPIIVKSFYSDRLALFTHVVMILIVSILSELGYEFTFLQILAGIVAVLVIEDTRSWNKFFISIFSIIAAYFIGHLGLCLIKYQPGVPIDWSVFKWLAISGVLTLLAYPFIPLLAKLFGFLSTITLTELADLNQPLLKELSINAPGTLQHSLQVANLSEAAAEKIGCNSLLLKVGALYHDVGKLHNPSVFIENQKGMNPHDHMTNFESARAIIDHVTEGAKMAKKAGLPKAIIDLIQTHHGTTRVEYFYRNQKNQFPDQEFDESLFAYAGPKPSTKEQTILMIADSLEAASKSLQNPTGQDIDQLVDKIVDYKITNGQLSDSALTFSELQDCLSVFKAMLRNINHVRVEYPELKKQE